MNETETCPRCGWSCTDHVLPTGVDGVPEGSPEIPLPVSSPHPIGRCVSPFMIGQRLYWNMDYADPDAPPLRVVFKELVEIQSAVYKLQDNEWVKEADAKPTVVSVLVDPTGIYPQHEKIYGRELLARPLEVQIGSLTCEENWPVIEFN